MALREGWLLDRLFALGMECWHRGMRGWSGYAVARWCQARAAGIGEGGVMMRCADEVEGRRLLLNRIYERLIKMKREPVWSGANRERPLWAGNPMALRWRDLNRGN
jgi:hypothetical protein